MNHWRTIFREITTSLNLRYEPSGVSLCRENEAFPAGVPNITWLALEDGDRGDGVGSL